MKCVVNCKCGRHLPHSKEKHPYFWTDEKLAVLKAEYNGSMESRERLAKRYGVGRQALWHALHRSGLLMRGWKSQWTEEEVEKLAELVPRMRLGEVAKRLGKSINAITAKMVTLRNQGIDISPRYREEWYVASEIALILGVDPQRVTEYIRMGKLRAVPNDLKNTPTKGSNGSWRITQGNFRKFLIEYPDNITVRRNVDFPALIDVLTRI